MANEYVCMTMSALRVLGRPPARNGMGRERRHRTCIPGGGGDADRPEGRDSPALRGVSGPRNRKSGGRLLLHASMSPRSERSSSSLVRFNPAGLPAERDECQPGDTTADGRGADGRGTGQRTEQRAHVYMVFCTRPRMTLSRTSSSMYKSFGSPEDGRRASQSLISIM